MLPLARDEVGQRHDALARKGEAGWARVDGRASLALVRMHSDILRKRAFAIAAVLALVALVAAGFSGTLDNEFMGVDDDWRIFENESLTRPLSWDSVYWAFSPETSRTYVQPLTWLLFRINVAGFGAAPRLFHAESVVAHGVVVVLLFLLLQRLTRKPAASFVACVLFALHPLTVEPVAWASELNALLASIFALVALHAYVGYARAPSVGRGASVLVAYVGSLLAKPWLFGLPFAMLALDFWPLGRWPAEAHGERSAPARRLLLEKVPLVVVGAGWAWWSMHQMEPAGRSSATSGPGLGLRLVHAPVAVVRYLGKLVWPVDLAIEYPFPVHVPLWQGLVALAVCVCLTAAAFRARRRAPSLLAGWGWFLAIIAPTLGIVQAGKWPAIADRFAYLPMVGIIVGLVFASAQFLERRTTLRWMTLGLVGAGVLVLCWATRAQVALWRDTVTFLSYSETVAPGSPMVEYNLGTTLGQQGRLREAEVLLRRSAERHDQAETRNQLGNVLLLSGRGSEAYEQYERAVALDPRNAEALYNLASSLRAQGRLGEARERLEQFVRVAPPWLEPVKRRVSRALAR